MAWRQVVKKGIPTEIVLASDTIQQNWLHDKLQRQAAYMLIHALASQIEMLTGLRLQDFALPEKVIVRRLRADETRVRLASGEFAVYDSKTGAYFIQLPRAYLAHRFRIISHVVDRGPVNSAALHFLYSTTLLMSVQFGWFHGLWNSIKNSLKKSSSGRPWQCVLGYLLVQNMNYFPFKSSQGWRNKQDALKLYMDTHDYRSHSFQQIKYKFAAANGKTCNCDEDEIELFALLGRMASFVTKGPLLKLMRWCSIHECWKFIRPELHGLSLILGEMRKTTDQQGQHGEALGTALSIDSDTINAASLKKPGGTVDKAHDWTTHAYNIFCMDMVCLVTEPLRKRYSHRASEVKSASQGFTYNLNLVHQGVSSELIDIARGAFFNENALHKLMGDEGQFRDEWMAELVDFTLTLMYYRLEALCPELESYPHCSITSLSPGADVRRAARMKMLDDLDTLLTAEELARSHDRLNGILGDIAWTNNSCVRLLLLANEQEDGHPDGALTTYILEAMHSKVPDEKAAEDLHQFIRDETRRQRYTKISPSRLMRTVLEAGVIERRGMQNISVTIEELCQITRYDASQKPVRHRFFAPPSNIPEQFAQITDPTRSWPSPTAASYLHSTSAWRWLTAWFRDQNWSESGTPIGAAWRSKLVPTKIILTETGQLVLASCSWGLLCWKLTEVSPGLWQLITTDWDAVGWQYITDVVGLKVAAFTGEYHQGIGVLFRAMPNEDVLRRALLKGTELKQQEWQDLSREHGIEFDTRSTIAQLKLAVVTAAFKDEPEEIKNIMERKHDVDDHEFGEDDKKLSDVLDDIALHDPDNMGELQDMLAALKKKTLVALHRARAKLRKAKAAAKANAAQKNEVLKERRQARNGNCRRRIPLLAVSSGDDS